MASAPCSSHEVVQEMSTTENGCCWLPFKKISYIFVLLNGKTVTLSIGKY